MLSQFRTNTSIASYLLPYFQSQAPLRLKSILAGLLNHRVHLFLHRSRNSLHFHIQEPANNHRHRGFLGHPPRHQVLDLVLRDLPNRRLMRQLGSKPSADLRDRVDHPFPLRDHQSLALDVSLRVRRISVNIRASKHRSALRDRPRDALASRALAVQQRARPNVQLRPFLRQQHAREVRHRVLPAEIRHRAHLRESSPAGLP